MENPEQVSSIVMFINVCIIRGIIGVATQAALILYFWSLGRRKKGLVNSLYQLIYKFPLSEHQQLVIDGF